MAETDSIQKTCTKCGVSKHLDAYCNMRRGVGGKNPQCKQCLFEYRQINADRIREVSRAYYLRNRDKHLARGRAYVAGDRERYNEKQRRWDRSNPAKKLAASNLRRSRKRQAVPQWADFEAIDSIYAEAIRRRSHGEAVDVDHIVPLTHRLVCGLHVAANLQVISAFENRSKGNKFVTDWS